MKRLKRFLIPLLTGIFILIGSKTNAQADLSWTEIGKDFHDAVPLGNGDIGVSAWVEKNGDLLFYIGKTDAYDDNNRLLKLGRIRVTLSPNPFANNSAFRQILHLKKGEMEIAGGSGDDQVNYHLWVDANNPAIHLSINSKLKFSTQVRLENWRRQERILTTDLSFSDPYTPKEDSTVKFIPTIQYPDSILSAGHYSAVGSKNVSGSRSVSVSNRINASNSIIWFHHNNHSCWPYTLTLQGLEKLTREQKDPLLSRTFGAGISGPGLLQENDTTLTSAQPSIKQELTIVALTGTDGTVNDWLHALKMKQTGVQQQNPVQSLAAHRRWWDQFWNRSRIDIQTTGDTGALVSRSYDLQRYLTACGGRGKGWIKFNGSIFTLPWTYDPDFRRWGSANWFQNVRLVYWPMIASGDFDVLAPFYGTYLSALPLAKERTRIYYKHDGAFFSETSYAWGTYSNFDYGFNRRDLPVGFAQSTYIRHYWSGGLELSTMMLEQYKITRHSQFVKDTLLPIAAEIVRFYDRHWKRDGQHKLLFDSAQSLETWQTATNPLPEIAGLQYVLEGLLALPVELTTPAQRSAWKRTLMDLPELPKTKRNGKTLLLPAYEFGSKSNVENPELYAVFPYRIFGIGKDSLDIGRNSFAAREFRENKCWWQDEIQAACLGLGRTAADGIVKRMTDWNKDFRFPAMWGPTNDEIPDLDHGGVGTMALQQMLLQSGKDKQTGKEKLYLFPAWPASWNVSFKLHGAGATLVEGEVKDGKLQRLLVTPESRRKDLVIMPLQ